MDESHVHHAWSSGFGKRKSHPPAQQKPSSEGGDTYFAAMAMFFAMLFLAGAITYYVFPVTSQWGAYFLIIPWFLSAIALMSVRSCRHGRTNRGIYLILLSFVVGMGVMAFLSSGMALFWGASAIFIPLSIVLYTFTRKHLRRALVIFPLAGLGIMFIGMEMPRPRMVLPEALQVMMPVILGVLLLVYVFRIIRSSRLYTFRAQLISVIILVALFPSAILAFLTQSVLLVPVREQSRNAMILGILILLLTVAVAFLLSTRMTKSIYQLTRAAERLAEGDLSVQAVEASGEFGQLANAFNMMTFELKNTLEELEGRVAMRTAELARSSEQARKHADQLQIVAEVARAITSVKDADELLTQVTHVISEKFGYYHVGIFLINKTGDYAVLQAANSEGGQRMLVSGHKLKVGQVGIVGYVTCYGEPRIALDVGADAVFFDNPDLPYTRSEMALPLKIGNRVIGALDVQSMEQSAFHDEDIDLLSTLADQVAVAIENARLISETKKALDELQTLHRQYVKQEWSDLTEVTERTGYIYQLGRMTPLAVNSKNAGWGISVGYEPKLCKQASPGNGVDQMVEEKALVVPIQVRGQVIGYFNLEKLEEGEEWSEDDLTFVKTISDQVGQALENARLLEQTHQRAEREHLVAEITARLRASNDPRVVLNTAMDELRQALKAKNTQVSVIPAQQPPEEKDAKRNGWNGFDPNETLTIDAGEALKWRGKG